MGPAGIGSYTDIHHTFLVAVVQGSGPQLFCGFGASFSVQDQVRETIELNMMATVSSEAPAFVILAHADSTLSYTLERINIFVLQYSVPSMFVSGHASYGASLTRMYCRSDWCCRP